MNKDDYDKDLLDKRNAHFRKVNEAQARRWKPCKHEQCTSCYGTGITEMLTPCVHMISCDCPKCSPFL